MHKSDFRRVLLVTITLLVAAVARAQSADGSATAPTTPPPPPPSAGSVDATRAPLSTPPDAESVSPAASPATPPPAAPASRLDGSLKRIELSDGQTLRGMIVSENPTEYTIELADGEQLVLPKRIVKSIASERGAAVKNGVVWFEDPNRTRYFYSPSAMMLKKGQAYFSQKELLFSSFAYGITDHFNVQVGAVVPAFFFGVQGINGIVAFKGGGQINEWLHVAGGMQALVVPGLGGSGSGLNGIAAGFLFGTVTAGTPDQHLSVSVGKPLALSAGQVAGVDSFIATVSANQRVGEHVALMTENWLLIPSIGTPTSPTFISAHAIGARVMGEKLSADLGFVWAFTDRGIATYVPVPWVDFTYNFDLLPPEPASTF